MVGWREQRTLEMLRKGEKASEHPTSRDCVFTSDCSEPSTSTTQGTQWAIHTSLLKRLNENGKGKASRENKLGRGETDERKQASQTSSRLGSAVRQRLGHVEGQAEEEEPDALGLRGWAPPTTLRPPGRAWDRPSPGPASSEWPLTLSSLCRAAARRQERT